MEQYTNPNLNKKPAQNNPLYDKINKDAFLDLVGNIRKIYSNSTLSDTDKLDEHNKVIEKWNEDYSQYLKSEWLRLNWGDEASFPKYQNDTTKIGSLLTDIRFHHPEYIFSEIQDCAVNLSDIDLPGAILQNISFEEGNLYNANLYRTYMKNVDFSNANLENIVMRSARLIEVKFNSANLKSAILFSVTFNKCILSRAILTGVRFGKSKFHECSCRWALFDGGSIFNDVIVDNNTDFTGSVIRNASMSPRLLTAIEDNMREIRWKEWYDKGKFKDINLSQKIILKIVQIIMICVLALTFIGVLHILIGENVIFMLFLADLLGFAILLCLISVRTFYNFGANLCMKCFWALTNYGRSTSGILIAYLAWTIVFTVTYFIFATPDLNDGFISITISILVTLFQTMISGFYPDFLITIVINPEFQLIWTLVTCTHLVGSYLLLAALVARFSILLNSLSP